MNRRNAGVLGAATLLVVTTFVAYLPAIRGGFIWDDDDYVTASEPLRTVEGLTKIWFKFGATKQYYPAVHTTFWVEYHLWGLNPAGYHLVNVALHSLNALLLWLLLRRLSIPGAYFAAAIFALHPVQVESVAWITERKNVLSCFFYLSSARAYFRFARITPAPVSTAKPRHQAAKAIPDRKTRHFYFLSLVLFLCALLSKTVTASLPAAILLVIWWKKGKLAQRDVSPLIPMFALGIALGLITAWLEKHNVGAIGAEWNLGAVERILIAGRALWFYAAKLLLPVNLAFIYPRWIISASAAWQYLFPVSAVAMAAILWLARRRMGRGPLAAVLFFAGTLTPALGFFDVFPMQYSFVADHFQYHASMGLIVLFAAALQSLLARFPISGIRYPAIIGGIFAALLALLTWHQSHIYRDLETLYRDTLRKNPECVLAHQNLGSLLLSQGRILEAKEHFSAILRMEPDNADTLANIGLAVYLSGDVTDAVRRYQQALAIQPNQVDALNNLAWIRATYPDGSYRNGAEAVQLAERACSVARQKSASYLDTLAASRAEAGDFEGAVRAIGEAIALSRNLDQPANAEIYQKRLALYQSRQPLREPPSQ